MGISWGFNEISGFLDRDFTKKTMGFLIIKTLWKS